MSYFETNAPNSLSAGAPPQTRLPDLLAGCKGTYLLLLREGMGGKTGGKGRGRGDGMGR